jgi:DNA repair exonuclease SbcCD ATPase subunit
VLVHALEVHNFRVIRQARLTFGRGLNVLFGPNDLGKSSLLDALRAAFLLPFTSKDGEAYISWGNTDKPRVVVQFETNGGVWQISKEFGAGARGSALLERFGESGIPLEKITGRAVEEKLQELLAWGIPAGPRRGLTETYLTTALLGQQNRVTEILAASIENNVSGREAVTKALEALEQHPLVGRLFQELEVRVGEAFTPAGGWKKNGPVARRTREIEEHKTCLNGLEERLSESNRIEGKVTGLAKKSSLPGETLLSAEPSWLERLSRRRSRLIPLRKR